MSFDLGERMQRARRHMAVSNVDVLLLSLGRDLFYLMGYEAPALERLTMAVIPAQGDVMLYVPELEAPKVVAHPDVFGVRPWGETEDPIALVTDAVGPVEVAAIGRSDLVVVPARAAASHARDSLRVGGADQHCATPAQVRCRDGAAARRRSRRGSCRPPARSRAFCGAHRSGTGARCRKDDRGGGPRRGRGSDRRLGPERSIAPITTPASVSSSKATPSVIDFGGTIGGYHSDTTRMFYVGEPGPEAREVHEVVRRAQEAGFSRARVGVAAQDVDRASRGVIDRSGFGSFFVHRTGHGIGLDVHEEPYLVEGNETPLAAGMAFSIEPGIYLPGRFGVRLEDIVVLGDDGPERMNDSPREPIVVD